MQFTGCDQPVERFHWPEYAIDGNEKRNATCAASKTSKIPTQDALLFISYSMLKSSPYRWRIMASAVLVSN